MDDSLRAIWFFGDLSDPWVVAIADALPMPQFLIRVDCSSELPSGPPEAGLSPRLIVVHRQRLVPGDAERLKAWRTQDGSGNPPALILCVGPYVRYEELERFSGLVDLVLSEATAAEVLPRHVTRLLDGRPSRPPRAEACVLRVLVASSNGELCRTIAEACASAGYRVEQADDQVVGTRARNNMEPTTAAETLLTVWDVPVLEAWTERLERHALQHAPVVALIGFPDRNTVALAKSKGAVACLELPLNLDDLIDVIDRCSRSLAKDTRALPGRVEPPHILPPRSRRRLADKETPKPESQWPAQGRKPTIA
jgi:AmiR/NasT family two-component response regulator